MNFKFIGMDYDNKCKNYPNEYKVPFSVITFGKTYWESSKHEYDLSVKYTNRLLKDIDDEHKKPLRNMLREVFTSIKNGNNLKDRKSVV